MGLNHSTLDRVLFKILQRFTLAGIFALTSFGATAQTSAITLEYLIQEALVSYPTILSKQASKDAAKSDLTASKLRFLPNPSFNTQNNQVSFDGGVNTGYMPSTNVTVSQPLWMGGSLLAGLSKSDARLNAADFALLEARQDISNRLITVYVEWLRTYLKIQALEENVRLHERLVDLISKRYREGVASGVDRDLGMSRLHQARAELESQRSIEQSTLTTISELVGQSILRQQLTSKPAKPVAIPNRQTGISVALDRSAAMKRVKFEVDASNAEAKEIQAQSLPQVSFQAQRQVGNAYYPGAPGFNAYGLVMSYTPGGGLSSFAATSAARDRARSAALQAETVKRDLTDKLNSEYNEYEFALLKKDNLQRAVTLSGDISSSYDRQYLVGRKNWLDLMNAVRESAQTKIQLADAEGSLIGASRRIHVYINGTEQFKEPAQ
jgi:adhesin transport system outer membrane protein